MAALTNRNTSHQIHAVGILAPIARLMTHLGYCLHATQKATDESWADAKRDILTDLQEATEHLNGAQSVATPFINAESIAHINNLKSDLEHLRSDNKTANRATMQTELLTLIHNAAFTAAAIDTAISGINAHAGTNT